VRAWGDIKEGAGNSGLATTHARKKYTKNWFEKSGAEKKSKNGAQHGSQRISGKKKPVAKEGPSTSKRPSSSTVKYHQGELAKQTGGEGKNYKK